MELISCWATAWVRLIGVCVQYRCRVAGDAGVSFMYGIASDLQRYPRPRDHQPAPATDLVEPVTWVSTNGLVTDAAVN